MPWPFQLNFSTLLHTDNAVRLCREFEQRAHDKLVAMAYEKYMVIFLPFDTSSLCLIISSFFVQV